MRCVCRADKVDRKGIGNRNGDEVVKDVRDGKSCSMLSRCMKEGVNSQTPKPKTQMPNEREKYNPQQTDPKSRQASANPPSQ